MERDAIVQQTQVEKEALGYLTLALLRTIEWPVEGGEFSRKLSSLRFVTESFQRHLERLFALEELDGYMDVVCQQHPEMAEKVDDLQQQQEQLRTTTRQLMVQLDRIMPTNLTLFEVVCQELRNLIKWLREYNRAEQELLSAAGLHRSESGV